MAQYTIGVPGCTIHQIRAAEYDNLVASMSLRVMNAEGGLHHDWSAQSVNVGGYVAGGPSVPINLFYPNVDVPDPTPESADGGAIYWSFLLVNASGNTNNNVLLTAINSAASAVVGDLVQGGIALSLDGTAKLIAMGANPGPLLLAGAIIGAQALMQVLNADCSGLIAAQAWAITAAELANMTAGNTTASNVLNYVGTQPPTGCGGISNYDVGFEVCPGPAVSVPNLVGQPPKTALSMAWQAGLGMQVLRAITGPNVEFPTVANQVPAPGSLVPRGLPIMVTVVNPPKVRP